MGDRVMASYGLLGDGKTAVIEMAEAAALPLVPKEPHDAPRLLFYVATTNVVDCRLCLEGPDSHP